ncbi:hypothetical protein [Actinokineospora globicatena]|uniref:Uncharacterized protein n=1 Tax=Actinokineospora globicatena TaxID=103729 RepID=A0A9W6V715_9PSEU|nr:hypothetical protein [Actinokineospora globicatena]GLW89524.1 hypothetical protein Aglo03_03400 [Actinokineospora globicatena]
MPVPSLDDMAGIPLWGNYLDVRLTEAVLGLIPGQVAAVGVRVGDTAAELNFQVFVEDAVVLEFTEVVVARFRDSVGPGVAVTVRREAVERVMLGARRDVRWVYGAHIDHPLPPASTPARVEAVVPRRSFPTPADVDREPVWEHYVTVQITRASLRCIAPEVAAIGFRLRLSRVELVFQVFAVNAVVDEDLADIEGEVDTWVRNGVDVVAEREIVSEPRLGREGVKWTYVARR